MTIDANNVLQMFEEIDNPAFFHDSQFRLILANAAYYREAGVTESEALGKPYWEIFPKGTGPLPSCKVKAHTHSNKMSIDEFAVGNKVFVSYIYSTIDHLSKSEIFFHVLTDVTKRVVAEKSLEKIANQFQILFERSPDAIILLDKEVFIDCNAAALSLFGCKNRSDLLDGNFIKKFSPPLQPDGKDSVVLGYENIAKAFKNGSNRFECVHSRLDGSVFQAEVSLVSFKQGGREVIQGTIRDITARKESELAKAKQAAELVIANKEKATLEAFNNDKLHLSLMETIDIARQLVELRDPYTAGHEQRVGELAKDIAVEMGFDATRQAGLLITGYLHDIGKIIIPAEILSKPGKITPAEYGLIKDHVQAGYDLLKKITFPWEISRAILEHHERLDGSGYPNQLNGDQISIEGRILAVADVVEAMSSYRPYRPALGIEVALAEIERGRGSLYDEKVVDACLKLFREKDYKIAAAIH